MNKRRLREALEQAEEQCVSLLLQRDDARIEIKRLRTEVNEWRRQLNENIALRREVERLHVFVEWVASLEDSDERRT